MRSRRPRSNATSPRSTTTSVLARDCSTRSSSRHGDPIDIARGEKLDRVGRDASTRELVEALVVPYAANLARPEDRDYLRIVAQLSAQFSTWREPAPGTGPYLHRDPGAARGATAGARRARAPRAGGRDDHADDGGDGGTGAGDRSRTSRSPSSTSRRSWRTSPTCSSACSRLRCASRRRREGR